MSEFPKFNPENQILANYIKLMKVALIVADIYEDEKKESIIFTHIPARFFDNLVSLSSPNSPSNLADFG